MNSTPDAPEPVLLVIADISGYRRYMTANAKILGHSQTVITKINTLIFSPDAEATAAATSASSLSCSVSYSAQVREGSKTSSRNE